MAGASNNAARTLSLLRGMRCAFIPCDLMQLRIQRLAHIVALLF